MNGLLVAIISAGTLTCSGDEYRRPRWRRGVRAGNNTARMGVLEDRE